jgi:membrane protein YdbS with pleckstrin-like domain
VTLEPTRRLAPRARWVWRGTQLVAWLVLTVIGFVVAAQLDGVWSTLVRVVPVVGLVAGTSVVPEIRWRRWRWDVQPEAIVIRHGLFTVRETLVPMLRVQHVDTTSDLLEQRLALATVVVHTAAGSHRIPLLTAADARELRDRIADLARTADEP